MALHVAFGIFAHDEEQDLPRLLDDLAAQDILNSSDICAAFHLLANGCSDGTAEIARRHALGKRADFTVHDLPEGGKSRTWNRFVHDLSSEEADFLGFLDADIRLRNPGHLSGLLRGLVARPGLKAFVSRPEADAEGATTPIARAILRGGGTAGDWRHGICGQCYLLRAEAARATHLPIGLPVEDGFLRAILLTENMERLDGPLCIDGNPALAHHFEPERTLCGFLRHQERIVVGGAVNTALFSALRAAPEGTRAQVLQDAAEAPGWIGATLSEELPNRRYGYVPWSFLYKRSKHMLAAGGIGRLLRLPAYFALDLIVYLRAQWRLARGIATDYW